MPVSLRRLFLILLALVLGPGALQAAKEHTETLFLFENRRVTFVMPSGFGFSSSKDDRGIFTVLIADAKDRAVLQMTFLPDPQNRLAAARAQNEFIFENFREFVALSREKAMQFEDLKPKIGAGTYCVLSDEALAGKEKVPSGSYKYSTIGVKTWPGVAAAFTLLSNGTATKEHQTLLTLLRESVREIPAPAK